MAADRVPVVFIHGLWLHSTSWQPWTELFRSAGYADVARAALDWLTKQGIPGQTPAP